jgi:flagellar hook assembly protein FlgD
VGTTVTLNGSNFAGATAVTFNNIAAQFEFVLDSELRAAVPTGATTGKIEVTNAAGTGTSAADFVVTSGGGTQTQTFTPTDDAFVWSAKPTNNYGTSTDLRVRKTSETQIAYFKFNVIGLSGSITSASLQLLCTDASPNGGSVYKVSNNFLNNSSSWTEGGLNWTNAPAVSGSALSSAGSIGVSQTVEWDVKAAITGNGIYSFAITNSSSDAAYYSSKEGTQVPQLVIQTSGSAIAANVVDETVDSKLQPQILSTPESLELFPNYPNPFNLETTIEYALPEAKDVRLSIYNIRGQEVRPLVDEYQSAGFKTVRWDGRDNFGREISSGLYFSRLVVGQTVLMQKLTLQK